MRNGPSTPPPERALRHASAAILRAGTSSSELQVVVLGWMLVAGGLFAMAGSGFTGGTDARRQILAIGAVALTVGVSTLLFRHRVTQVGVHSGLLLGALMITVIAATTDNAAAMGAGACFVVWIAVFAACFFTPLETVAHVGAALVMLCVALSVVSSDIEVVVVVMVSAAVNAAVVAASVGWLSVQLRRSATVDALTGLVNTAAWRESLAAEIERSDRTGSPFSVVFVDVDGLKSVNDRGGHAAGDELLASVATCLRCGVRSCDTVARVGGDEFVIALPDTTAVEAEAIMTRLRRDSPASFSVGVAQRRAHEDSTALVERADAEMYRRKRRRTVEAAALARREDRRQVRPRAVG